MGKRHLQRQTRSKRRYYPLALLLLGLAALALSASLATSAHALPTFTTAVNGIGPCQNCHGMSATHSNPNHAAVYPTCSNCHPGDPTTVPPTPAKCGACHGGVTTILASAAHTTQGCGATIGCHGVNAASITSFAPPSGPIGTNVTITGIGFVGATAVAFNGTPAVTFTVNSATQIHATVPAGATDGTITVTPASGPVATSSASFTVTTGAVATTVSLKVAPTSIKLKKTVKASGAVTPVGELAGTTVACKAQMLKGKVWVSAKSGSAKVSPTGTYSWTYKPAKKGSYRITATVAGTASHLTSTATKTFKVK